MVFIPRFQTSGKNCPSIAGLPEKDSERLKKMVLCWLTCRSDSSDQSKALSGHPGVSGTREEEERQVGER